MILKVDSKNNTSASVTSSSLPSSSSASDSNSRRESSNSEKSKSESNKKSPTPIKKQSEEDITSFYLKQIDSTLDSTIPLKLSGDVASTKLDSLVNKHQSVIDELSSINFLEQPTPPPAPPNLSSFQRETLLTFATDDTLINNAITAAINNSNQTMKSFKKPSEIIDGFRDDFLAGKKKQASTGDKRPGGFTSLESEGQCQQRQSTSLAHGVFQRSANFTKIFDSCTGGATASTTLMSRLQPKEDNFMLLNQPMSKDVCDLFAVESTVI